MNRPPTEARVSDARPRPRWLPRLPGSTVPVVVAHALGTCNEFLLIVACAQTLVPRDDGQWLTATANALPAVALLALPRLLCQPLAGALADRIDRARVQRLGKQLELLVSVIALYGWVWASLPALLFAVAAQSALAALSTPARLAQLAQSLDGRQSTAGLAWLQAWRFGAMLVGGVLATLLLTRTADGPQWVAVCSLALSLVGSMVACAIPASPVPARVPRSVFDRSAASARRRDGAARPLLRAANWLLPAWGDRVVVRSLVGVGWAGFLAATLLSQLPALGHQSLDASVQGSVLLCTVFVAGIAFGSLICARLSRHGVEIGLVPLGAIGLTACLVDLSFAGAALARSTAALPGQPLAVLLGNPAGWRLLADLAGAALCAGLSSVPMQTLVLQRSPAAGRGRTIAAAEAFGALCITLACALGGWLLAQDWTIASILLLVAGLNALMTLYVLILVPEYLLRTLALIVMHGVYRIRVRGIEHLPADGPALLTSNHVSFVDAIVLMAVCPRPIAFVMDKQIFDVPVIGTIFRLARAIPITSRRDDPIAYQHAFDEVARTLAAGEIVAIFPEGGLTRDGQLQTFKPGFMKILAQQPVPVLPIALTNLWGSFFSRIENGKAMVRPMRRGLFNRIGVSIAAAVPAEAITPEGLRDRIAAMISAAPDGRVAR